MEVNDGFLTDKQDIDPIVQIIVRRVMQVRRTACKKPELKTKSAKVLKAYIDKETGPGWYPMSIHMEPAGPWSSPSHTIGRAHWHQPRAPRLRSTRAERPPHKIYYVEWPEDRQALQHLAGERRTNLNLLDAV